MRIAIVDLGTNSVRFDIHQIAPDGTVKTLYREKVMIRLGQGVFLKGSLDPHVIHRTLDAFLMFKKIITGLHVKKVMALGTSALREAQNGTELVRKIKKFTGIEIRIVSGKEEARLIAIGILANEPIGNEKIGLIDIGGGSTELTICHKGKILHSVSLPMGSARLQQIFLKDSPPTTQAIKALRQYVKQTLASLSRNHWPPVEEFLGSSGTVRALTKLAGKFEKTPALGVNELKKFIGKIRHMTASQLLEIPGMEQKRADMILSGALLLRECMKVLNVQRTVPTYYSLRDGILQEQLALQKKRTPAQFAFRLPDLYERAIRFGESEKHIQAMMHLTTRLFQSLRALHGLDKTWKVYLGAAVILRNSGEIISFLNHPEHSYYLVKHAGFPFTEEWETELVASLCRHHESVKLSQTKELPFRIDKPKKRGFLKLLAILCIIDALDTDLVRPVHIKKIRINQSNVHISLEGGSSLEVLRVGGRARLFESVFKKQLVVHQAPLDI